MIRLEVLAPGARGMLARRRPVGLGDVQTDFYATLQTRQNQLSTAGSTAIKSQTGVDITSQRVKTGALAAVSLAENGYDPTSTADNDKLVAAIAGGAALIPGVGPLIGAAVEGLYQVGKTLACPIEQAFASIGLSTLPPACGGAVCNHTGPDATPASVIAANAGELPAHDATSFGAFAVGALAAGAASAINCRGALPPGVIVDAVVNIWNQTHAGPAIPYLVPPLNQLNKGLTAFGWGSPIITQWGNVSGSANTPATRAGQDPYVYYAFFPVGTTTPDHPSGSLPTSAGPWTPWSVARPPAGQNVDPPRVVMVNTGAALPPSQPAFTPTSLDASRVATQFQQGHTYMMVQTGMTPAYDETSVINLIGQLGFSPVQILWWGPTGKVDDPQNYLNGQKPTDATIATIVATYTKAAPMAVNVYALDVTGLMTPRQTVVSSTAATVAAVTVGSVAAVAVGGTLWALVQKQAIGYFWGKVFDRFIEGGKSLYQRAAR